MLQNVYLLAKIGADTAENEQRSPRDRGAIGAAPANQSVDCRTELGDNRAGKTSMNVGNENQLS